MKSHRLFAGLVVLVGLTLASPAQAASNNVRGENKISSPIGGEFESFVPESPDGPETLLVGDVAAVSVPEPATLLLFGTALLGLGVRFRKNLVLKAR